MQWVLLSSAWCVKVYVKADRACFTWFERCFGHHRIGTAPTSAVLTVVVTIVCDLFDPNRDSGANWLLLQFEPQGSSLDFETQLTRLGRVLSCWSVEVQCICICSELYDHIRPCSQKKCDRVVWSWGRCIFSNVAVIMLDWNPGRVRFSTRVGTTLQRKTDRQQRRTLLWCACGSVSSKDRGWKLYDNHFCVVGSDGAVVDRCIMERCTKERGVWRLQSNCDSAGARTWTVCTRGRKQWNIENDGGDV